MQELLAATDLVDGLRAFRDAGMVIWLIFVIFAGYKGWFIFGKHHQERIADLKAQIDRERAEFKEQLAIEREEKNAYKTQTMRVTSHAEEATALAEVVARALAEKQSPPRRRSST